MMDDNLGGLLRRDNENAHRAEKIWMDEMRGRIRGSIAS